MQYTHKPGYFALHLDVHLRENDGLEMLDGCRFSSVSVFIQILSSLIDDPHSNIPAPIRLAIKMR